VGLAIALREQFGTCRTVSIDMLAASALGFRMVAAANLVEVADQSQSLFIDDSAFGFLAVATSSAYLA
jgi:hypothetical protein